MVGGTVGYVRHQDVRSVGHVTIGAVLGLAFLGEIVEWWLGFRLTRTFGGSRRSAWGALVGGIVGAVLGVPLPIVGSVIGAFLGSFAGPGRFRNLPSPPTGTGRAAGGGPRGGGRAARAA